MRSIWQYLRQLKGAPRAAEGKHPTQTTPSRIVAIPYAGGDRYSYRTLQTVLPKHVKLEVLELPGRGPSRKLPRLQHIQSMVNALHTQWHALNINEPYIMLGHSMGAILSYELMHRLHVEGQPLPERAWLSSIPAPSVRRAGKVSQLPSTAFWEVMRSYRGVPEPVLANPEMRDYFEPVLRDDFSAIENYRPLSGKVEALPVKLYVRWGTEEQLTEAQMQKWSEASSREVDFARFPGHHFFLFQQPEAVLHILNPSHT